jgi:uncharacterized protein YegL
MSFIQKFYQLVFTLSVLLLISCGGGGGTTDPTSTGSSINVTYTKGPVSGASATLLDANGNRVAGPVTTVNGQASFSNVTYRGLVFAQFSGGSYTDEATGSTVNLTNAFQIRSGVINNTASGTLQLTATPLTEIGFQRAEVAEGGTANLNNVNTFVEQVADEYGLDNINLTTAVPTPLQNITGSSDSDRYGTVLAGITQQQTNTGNTPSEVSLGNYITTTVSNNLDQIAFTNALSDLQLNTNTSSFVSNNLISGISSNIGTVVTSTYTVGGSVTGLTGSVTLQNNAGDDLILNSNSSFTFSTAIQDGATYSVSISNQPTGQTCSLVSGSGTISGTGVTTVSINCNTNTVATYTVGGSVTGLTGSVTLQNNAGDDLILNSNSSFTFSTAIQDGATYSVSISNQPTGQTCSLVSGSGTISGTGVTTVSINCLPNVAFSGLGVTSQLPSVITSAFHVYDKFTGKPVLGLTADDFEILEDGVLITRLESFKDLEQVENIPIDFYTVLLLDISSSLNISDINQVKEAAKSMIIDPVTGLSKLLKGQKIAIYTFDGNVNRLIDFTDYENNLIEVIDGITGGGVSTNLFGAIIEAANDWTNSFGLNNITFGSMVVITDGDHTSGIYTQQDVIDAIGEKSLYAIPVGSNTNIPVLEDIMGTNHVFPTSNYTQLGATFNNVLNELNSFTDGLYLLYYATPKRGDQSHTLTISVNNNSNIEADNSILGSFNSSGFSDVTPEIIITGEKYIPLGETIIWTARTRWTNNPPNYIWTMDDPRGLVTLNTTIGDTSTVTVTNVNSLVGEAVININDVFNNLTNSKNINIVRSDPFTILVPGHKSVALHWSSIPSVTNYRVYFNNTGNVTPADTLLTMTSKTQFTHFGLNPSLNYYYLIVPVDGEFNAVSPNVVSAQPFDKEISLASSNSCLLKNNKVSCWGGNFLNEADVPTLQNPRTISSSRSFSCVIDDTGVVCWGDNSQGQLDVPTLVNPQSISLSGSTVCALDDTGIVCWGDTYWNVPNLDEPSSVALGVRASCALERSGVVCWGDDTYGVLSIPLLNNPVQIAVGEFHACALDDTGVVCWGDNRFGDITAPPLINPTAISISRSSCAIDNTGVVCWGGGYSPPTITNPEAIYTGSNNSCSIDSSQVICWGNNWYNISTVLNNPTKVEAGNLHTCTLDSNGVLCVGKNTNNIFLPIPNLSNPISMSLNFSHLCAIDGTDLVCSSGFLQTLSNPVSVTVGRGHWCSLDDTGVSCWGSNVHGALTVPGLTNPNQVSAGGMHTCAIDDTGVVCWGDNSFGQSTVPILSNPVEVSAGGNHTCALDDTGVVCWGNNSLGQSTVPILSNPIHVSAGKTRSEQDDSHTCVIDDTGVVCWGFNILGQSTVPILSNPVEVSAGVRHTCALDDTGVVCWGSNNSEQLYVPGSN